MIRKGRQNQQHWARKTYHHGVIHCTAAMVMQGAGIAVHEPIALAGTPFLTLALCLDDRDIIFDPAFAEDGCSGAPLTAYRIVAPWAT